MSDFNFLTIIIFSNQLVICNFSKLVGFNYSEYLFDTC
jgi:hypothetical protein